MDVKATLKEAREAIKSKNYESCLKLCKRILKEEKENYTALVFYGVSLQETGQSQNAVKAFKEAIRINPTNPLAWNGLTSYFEKVDSKEAKIELVQAYVSLLGIEANEKKLNEYATKLSELYEYGNVSETASAIHTAIQKCSDQTNIWSALINLLSKGTIPQDLETLYEDGLKFLLNNQKTVCTEYYAKYLKLLYKQNRMDEFLEKAIKMHDLFEINSTSLKWICKAYNETYIETGKFILDRERIARFHQTLLKLESESPNAMLTKSILLASDEKFDEAREVLSRTLEASPGLLHGWVLLARCCVKLVLFSEAVSAVNNAVKLAGDNKNALKNQLNGCLLEALSKSSEKEELSQAVEIYEKMGQDVRNEYLSHVIRANVRLGNYAKARVSIEDVQDSVTSKLLRAELFHAEKQYGKALEILESEDVSLAEWWIETGTCYWDDGRPEKSLVPFLKAAKLEPNNYLCFLLLGNYYKRVGDWDKARRCYEKSFRINSKCTEAGVELSKIYMRTKNWESNLALLKSLTTDVINKKNCWAWMQLGLNYLEQGDYDKAINSLRFVIRIDEDNMHCWESLADAYSAKGAYTSALKCYVKASELSKGAAVYPLLQMACIKQILGEYAEARHDFQEILLGDKHYVPALKGVAETCLSQARECYNDQRLGTARDHAQFAAEKLIIAVQQRSDLSSLWKLLADSCIFVTKLPEKFSCLLLPKSFLEAGSEGKKFMEKEDLFGLAAKCYCKCLQLVEDDALVWHDLAACYLSHALSTRGDKDLMSKAEAVVQHCISKNPTHWPHWNLLGNIAFNRDPPNYRLAQHALIKAVIADNNSAVAWCNLGTLYLVLGDHKLANDAFSQAQRSDPNYVNSWIGQALLAESFKMEDAMDLFRHSTSLSQHQQGALGYAHWVCQTLMDSPPDATIYSIHNMHAIPVACDALTWYTEKNPDDGAAWNMLGILRERMGLKRGAGEAFKNALCLSRKEYKDLARVNFGRTLHELGRYREAIEMFEKVEGATFKSGTGLALALFKSERYKESYDSYQAALHWLTDDQSSQSDLLVALAAMAYMFEGPDNSAKTLLFQSVQLENPSPWAFYATLSLGLLHDDLDLAELVYKELSVLKDQKSHLQHLALLCSYLYLLQGNFNKSICEVSKLVHRYPDQAGVWLTLSSLLVRVQNQRPVSSSAARCAQIAMRLGQANMDVTKVLSLVSLSSLISGDKKQALLAAQKAVHCYPDVKEGWAVLAASLYATNERSQKLGPVFKHVDEIGTGSPLPDWANRLSLKI